MSRARELHYHFRSTPQRNNRQLTGLHAVGYQMIKGAVQIDESILFNVKETSANGSQPVFNHNEVTKHNDFKRKQCNLEITADYMQQFDRAVRGVVKTQVNTDLIPTDPAILHSRPGCQPQAAHCDYIPDDALKSVTDTQMPLAILIALMPGTRLKIWPNSCRLALKNANELRGISPIECVEVELEPGDMLIFRGDFVHAGSGYENDNYRIHYYLDSRFVPREANRTWLVHKSGNEEMQRIIRIDAPAILPSNVKSQDEKLSAAAPKSRKRDLDAETADNDFDPTKHKMRR